MGIVKYGQTIGIFSSDYKGRLDIGTATMKKKASASHVSSATKLRIRRVDGPSVDEVMDDHIIGIFSEDNKYCLDIGKGSMKKTQAPTHLSSATELKIWPATQQNGRADQAIMYDDIIGVFSADGDHRLDIGSASLTPQKASHVSWATELLIQANDPIVEVGDIRSMKYNIEEAKTTDTSIQELHKINLPNQTNVAQSFELNETVSWTEKSTFENTVGFKVGTKVSAEASVPLIAKGKVEVSTEASFPIRGALLQAKLRQLLGRRLLLPRQILK